MAEIVIDERFRGPPDSGNGGYVAGRLAAFVDAPAVEVRLVAPPPPVGLDEARAAAARTALPIADHPFPTCFGCGPLREPGDALCHRCGPVAGGDLLACPATTDPRLPTRADGTLAPEVVWAALDCPSAAPVVPAGSRPHVLGTLTARLERPVRAGEPHVCVAWALGADGRKKRGAAAVLDAGGRLCAIAEAVWIETRAR